jgi:hypothetical protein
MGISRHYHIPVSITHRLRLLAIAVVGGIASAAPAEATMLTVLPPSYYLFYQNVGPNDYVLNDPRPGGEFISFGADNVVGSSPRLGGCCRAGEQRGSDKKGRRTTSTGR